MVIKIFIFMINCLFISLNIKLEEVGCVYFMNLSLCIDKNFDKTLKLAL